MMKFSICIPAYKATFFEECLQSVLNQNYPNFEVVILNDNSPEDIETIVENNLSDKVRYYKNDTNVGAEKLIDTWNKLLNLATGDYVCVIGDDDILAPHFLKEFSKLIDKYPTLDVYHCRSTIINDEGSIIGFSGSLPEHESMIELMWSRYHDYREQFIGDFVYRREHLLDAGGFYYLPFAWGTDVISSFRAAERNGIANTNDPIFNYRRSSLTISSDSGNVDKIYAKQQEFNWVMTKLKTNPKSVKEKEFTKLFLHYFPNLINRTKRIMLSNFIASAPIVNTIRLFKLRHSIDVSFSQISSLFLKSIIKKLYNVF